MPLTKARKLKRVTRKEHDSLRLFFDVKKINDEKQLVYGEVYAPYILDTHGDMMLAEDVELLAHRFMMNMKNGHIDVMHNNVPINAVAVESFVAHGSPDFNEGAWVLATKVFDNDVWADIKAGKFNGYSMEAMVTKVPAVVEYHVYPRVFGVTADANMHNHVFSVQFGDDGRVYRGYTSVDDGHSHDILSGTATEKADDHSHRFFVV